MFNSFPALMPFTYTLLIGTPVHLPDVCVHHAKVFPIRLYDLYTHQCHMEQASNKVFQTCLHNVGTNSGKQHSKAKARCTVQAPKRAPVHISLCFLRVWFTKLCRWLFVPYIWPVHTFPGERLTKNPCESCPWHLSSLDAWRCLLLLSSCDVTSCRPMRRRCSSWQGSELTKREHAKMLLYVGKSKTNSEPDFQGSQYSGRDHHASSKKARAGGCVSRMGRAIQPIHYPRHTLYKM